MLVSCSTFNNSKQLKKESAKESEGLFGLENSFVIGGIKASSDTSKDLQILFEDNKIVLKNKNTSLEVGENDIKFITPAGINYWSTHTAIGNLGAPTSPPTPGT